MTLIRGDDPHCRIITFPAHSLMPLDMDNEDRDAFGREYLEISERLRPSIIVCRGRPQEHLPYKWIDLFPSAHVLVFSEDTRHHWIGDGTGGVFSGGFQDAGFEANSNYHLLFDTCHSAYTDRPYTFRYRLHLFWDNGCTCSRGLRKREMTWIQRYGYINQSYRSETYRLLS